MATNYAVSSIMNVEGAPGTINIKDGANASQFRASAALASNITFTLPSTSGTTGQALKSTSAGITSWGLFNSNFSLPLTVNLGGLTAAGITLPLSAVYVTYSYFVYRGTSTESPIGFFVFSGVISGTAVGNVRLLNLTSGLVIVTNSISGGVQTPGAISNVPATESLIAFQARKTSGVTITMFSYIVTA